MPTLGTRPVRLIPIPNRHTSQAFSLKQFVNCLEIQRLLSTMSSCPTDTLLLSTLRSGQQRACSSNSHFTACLNEGAAARKSDSWRCSQECAFKKQVFSVTFLVSSGFSSQLCQANAVHVRKTPCGALSLPKRGSGRIQDLFKHPSVSIVCHPVQRHTSAAWNLGKSSELIPFEFLPCRFLYPTFSNGTADYFANVRRRLESPLSFERISSGSTIGA